MHDATYPLGTDVLTFTLPACDDYFHAPRATGG